MTYGARFSIVRLSLVIGFFLTALCPQTWASSLRYAEQVKGKIIITGNTLGLAGEYDANGPGTEDSIHTFTSTSSSLIDDLPVNPGNPWSYGTTYDWTLNSSSAQLTLPTSSTVLYAELIWGGSYRYGPEDVTSHIDDAVSFTTPATTHSVNPDAATAVTISQVAYPGYMAYYYVRSADVTSLVAAGGSGTYTVGAVPGTQDESINTLNALGWSLIVVIADDSESCRSLFLFTSGSWVDEVSVQSVPITGFVTPSSGDVTGRLLTGAIGGDADRGGDSVAIRDPSSSAFMNLSGPNNPETNFFASQINATDGTLDTSGTWGDLNHDAINGVNVSGGRQGWDQTGIELSSQLGTLGNDQTSTEIRFATLGDAFVPTFVAFEVDADPSLCPAPSLIFADGFESGDTSAWSKWSS